MCFAGIILLVVFIHFKMYLLIIKYKFLWGVLEPLTYLFFKFIINLNTVKYQKNKCLNFKINYRILDNLIKNVV